MKLSIICNTRNHLDITSKYLPDMISSCGVEHQLILHDNNSVQNVTGYLRDEFEDSYIIKSPTNIGVPAGLNKMLSYCEGEYIAKIDPDFIMPKDWALKAINLIETIPNIGLVGFYWGRGLIHKELQKGKVEKIDENIIFVPIKVFGVWVFHRSIIDKVGCFYDKVIYGNWDSEFNQRLLKHGYRNIYHRNDSVHMGEDSQLERDQKDTWRSAVEIPTLEHYHSALFNDERFSKISKSIK